jgi:hypothetical protein
MATNLQQTDSIAEEADKSEEADKYVHLIGSAEIKYEDGQFIVYFLDDNGKRIEEAEPLAFSPKAESIKLLDMHLIVELGEEKFDGRMENFKKAFPFIKALIEPETTKGTIRPLTGDEKSPFHLFMNPTDPPKK